MATVKEKLAAWREMLIAQKADPLRVALSTPDATALAAELLESEPDVLRHPTDVQVSIAKLVEIGEAPKPDADDMDAQLARGVELAKAVDAFWSVFEGQLVDDVEIIRRR